MSNARITNTAVYTSSFTPSTTPLTAISGTQLLTCQSNRFIDNSTNAYALTASGSPSVQRFSPFNATSAYSTSVIGGSGYFDGTTDYLSASTTAGDFGSSAFTIEAWVYFNSASGTQVIGSTYQSSSVGWSVGKSNSTGCFYVGLSGDGNDINGTTTVVAGTWYHIAVSGTPGATGIKLFVNGVQEGSTYTGAVSLSATVPVYIGDLSALGFAVNGYISNFRLVKGSAVYTSNFTPPTAPLTAITNTSLLCNFTNAGVLDNAMMNDLETVGNAQISTSVVKYGTGSMYFDGTGDGLKNLNVPILYLTTGDWTVEGWFYTATPNASVATRTLFCTGSPVQIYSQSNTVAMYVASDNIGTYFVNPASGPASSVSANTWTHFACVKNGNNYTVYVNGVAGTTVTSSTAPAIPTGITGIGYYAPTASGFFTGYIDDFRITKGYARYTSNFTPPTAAFPNN
jgi:hypothetical protein